MCNICTEMPKLRVPRETMTSLLLSICIADCSTELLLSVTDDDDLRRYAANDKIIKLFFLHHFLASTIYNDTIKNKFDIG